MLQYEFHPLAEKELDEAVEYYEAVESGKGLELLQQVHESIEQICRFPKSAPVSYGRIRSVVV